MMPAQTVKIGIIGGTGLDDPDILQDRNERKVATPFGEPSDALIEGKIEGVDCVLLARHGRLHTIMPSKVNYRANIWAFKELGCTHVVVTTACGSLKEELHPGDLVFIDQFIDRTRKREDTFYDSLECSPAGICHIPMAEPFCGSTRKILAEAAEELGFRHQKHGTTVTIEGPRFSTRAESNLYRSWGADVVNMTTVPEVVLANEAGLCYAAIALVTDYDCWRVSSEPVSVDQVTLALKENAHKATQLILKAIPKIAKAEWEQEIGRRTAISKAAVMLPPSTQTS